MNDRGAGITGFRTMALAVYAFGVTSALDIYPLLGDRTIGGLYNVAFLAVTLLWMNSYRRKLSTRESLLILLVILLAAWSTTSTLWTPATVPVFMSLISLAQSCVLFACLIFLLPTYRAQLLHGFAIGAIAAALLLLLFGTRGSTGRLSLMGADENITAYIFTAGATAILLGNFGKAMLPAVIVSNVFLFLMTLQTGSRTGMVAFLAVHLIVVLTILPRKGLLMGLPAVAAISTSAYYLRGFALHWEHTPARMLPLLKGDTQLDDSNRGIINDVYLRQIDDWWLLGTGHAGSNAYIASVTPNFALSSHNTVLRIWIELGILGLLMILGVLALALYPVLVSSSSRRYLLFVVPTILFSFTLGGLELSSTAWISLAIVSVRGTHIRETDHSDPELAGAVYIAERKSQRSRSNVRTSPRFLSKLPTPHRGQLRPVPGRQQQLAARTVRALFRPQGIDPT